MIACVRLPHFAAALEAHDHPDLRDRAFVLVDGETTVSGVSAQAARAGVRTGMSTTQAHALCADLVVRPALHSRTQRAFGDLLDALTTFTTQVESETGLELRADGRQRRQTLFLHPDQFDDFPTATCYLDLGTLKPDEAPDLARQMLRFVKQQTHTPAKLGLSSGKFPARVAATSVNSGEFLVVPGGHEAHFLAGFTAGLLPVDGETLRQLDLLGWHTLGDVAAQPAAALRDRFGKQGHTMHRLANGRDTNPVGHYQPPVVARANRQLESPVADWPRLEVILNAMVADAVADALSDTQTVRHIMLVLGMEDGTVLEQQVALRQPSANLRHLQETIRDMAQSLPLAAGVMEVELSLSDIVQAVPRQLSLFERPAVSQAHLNAVLRDLVARYGDTHFYWARAVSRDSRLPERRYRWEKANAP